MCAHAKTFGRLGQVDASPPISHPMEFIIPCRQRDTGRHGIIERCPDVES